MRLRIDGDACTGHGRCYALAPDLFDSDDFGHGVVLVVEPVGEQLEQARTAVVNCPERAITLEP